MKFNYIARNKVGEIQSGVVEASSRDTAVELLHSYQLYVTSLEEVSVPFYAKKVGFLDRVSRRDIVFFSRQIATMFKSDIALIEIFQTLAKQTNNRSLKEKILGMIEKIEGGNSLSKTFSAYPEIFDAFYINMVKAGEASGKLSDVFLYLADHLEKDYYFKSKIQGVMIYPAFVLLVFLGVVIAMVYYIIPQLGGLLAETGTEMPAITKFLVSFSNLLLQYGGVILAVFIGLILMGVYYIRTPEGKKFFDRILLKIPFIKQFLMQIHLSRFSLNLSTLISGGLPIVQALEISGEVVGNEVYKSIILETVEGVKRGEQISTFLHHYPDEISPLFIQMVVVGEKTGRLDTALLNVFDFYQKETERSLDNFTRVLEPLMIVVLGGIVGLLMAAVLLPLYQSVYNFG